MMLACMRMTTIRRMSWGIDCTDHDLESGDIKEVSTGTGEPEFRIVFKYPNYEEAKAAVVARAKSVKSGSDSLDITMPARSSLVALVAEGI